MDINILAILGNCIVALGSMRPRVDQPEIFDTAKAVIRALDDCRTATQHLLQIMDDLEKKNGSEEKAESAEMASAAAQSAQAAADAKEEG